MLKWLLAGIFFLGLGAAAYVFERSKDPGFSRNRYGGVIRTTINGIEIFRESKPAAVDTPAALYFKAVEPETVFIDDIIRNVDDTGKGQ